MEMTVNEATDSPLATEMKICILENLNRRYTDEKLSSFLLKASFLDPRYKTLRNLAKEGAMLFTKQAVKDMCMKVVDNKAASSEKSSTLPSLPAAAAAVKQEAESDDNLGASTQEPQMKKIKYEPEDYDDWLDDVIYVKTEKEKIQTSTYELVNQELEKYDAELQIRGDPLQVREYLANLANFSIKREPLLKVKM